MTQKDKELLLKDLCARLPYRPIVKCKIINLKEEQYVKDNHLSHIVHPTYEGNGYLYSVNILSQSIGIRPILKHLEYREQVYFEKICNDGYINVENIKPYLRPMFSMTEEETKEYHSLCVIYSDHDADDDITYYYFDTLESFDYLNKKMFDYRGLIPKSLAISTDDFNPYVEN